MCERKPSGHYFLVFDAHELMWDQSHELNKNTEARIQGKGAPQYHAKVRNRMPTIQRQQSATIIKVQTSFTSCGIVVWSESLLLNL